MNNIFKTSFYFYNCPYSSSIGTRFFIFNALSDQKLKYFTAFTPQLNLSFYYIFDLTYTIDYLNELFKRS